MLSKENACNGNWKPLFIRIASLSATNSTTVCAWSLPSRSDYASWLWFISLTPCGSFLPRLLIFIRNTLWQCRAPGWWPAPTLPPAVPWLVGELFALPFDEPTVVWICYFALQVSLQFSVAALVFALKSVLSFLLFRYPYVVLYYRCHPSKMS